jgi:hypothetical protein
MVRRRLRRIVVKVLVPLLASLFVSTVAFAQPGEPAPPEPAPTTAPPPTAPGPVGPAPVGPQPAYAVPPPTYAPAPVPGYAAAGPWVFHHGVTFEANVGVGYVHESASYMGATATNDTDAALAGADISLGGWINPQLALTVRIAGLQLKDTHDGVTTPASGEIIHGIIGPNVQYWLAPNVWIGGGIGVSVLAEVDNDCNSNCSTTGFGFNLRAGYSYPLGGANALSFSAETNTGFYSQDDGMGNTQSLTLTGISFLAGYQYL